MVIQVLLGSSFGGRTSHTTFMYVTFSSIHRFVLLTNYTEVDSPINTLFLGGFISCLNALVHTYNLITVEFLPTILVFGISTELVLFRGLTPLSVQ